MENQKTTAFNDIAARYTAARTALRAAKKGHGKKAAEAKAARKVVRGIKKERADFMAANPDFVAPPKTGRKKTTGMVRKEEEPKVDRSAGESIGKFRAGRWYLPDGVTPDDARNAELQAAGAVMNDLVTVQAAAPGAVGEPIPAPVATEVVKPAAKGLTALVLEALAAGNAGTPSQHAAWVNSGAGTAFTPKQVADTLARLVKTGKATKTEGRYAKA